MTSQINTLIEQRISANQFDPTKDLSAAQIKELVRLATRAPTAFNFQNWKFIAVQSKEAKERLKAVSYGQQKLLMLQSPLSFAALSKRTKHFRRRSNPQ